VRVSSSPATSSVSRSMMPAATAMSSVRANPSNCSVGRVPRGAEQAATGRCLRRSGKSSSSSSRRWTRSWCLKNSPHSFPGRSKPSSSISVRGSTAQPHWLHESSVMVARERDQGVAALHSTTMLHTGCSGATGRHRRRLRGSAHNRPLGRRPPSRGGRDPHEPGLRQARVARRGGVTGVGHPSGDPAQGYDPGGAEGPEAAPGASRGIRPKAARRASDP